MTDGERIDVIVELVKEITPTERMAFMVAAIKIISNQTMEEIRKGK